eukprot:scaffold2075_cov101-Isochrysis_galbana.AAC.3
MAAGACLGRRGGSSGMRGSGGRGAGARRGGRIGAPERTGGRTCRVGGGRGERTRGGMGTWALHGTGGCRTCRLGVCSGARPCRRRHRVPPRLASSRTPTQARNRHFPPRNTHTLHRNTHPPPSPPCRLPPGTTHLPPRTTLFAWPCRQAAQPRPVPAACPPQWCRYRGGNSHTIPQGGVRRHRAPSWRENALRPPAAPSAAAKRRPRRSAPLPRPPPLLRRSSQLPSLAPGPVLNLSGRIPSGLFPDGRPPRATGRWALPGSPPRPAQGGTTCASTRLWPPGQPTARRPARASRAGGRRSGRATSGSGSSPTLPEAARSRPPRRCGTQRRRASCSATRSPPRGAARPAAARSQATLARRRRRSEPELRAAAPRRAAGAASPRSRARGHAVSTPRPTASPRAAAWQRCRAAGSAGRRAYARRGMPKIGPSRTPSS